MERLKLKQIIEAAILAAGRPLSIEQMIALFEGSAPERGEIKAVLEEIERDCMDRGFLLSQVASGYRFQVRVELSDWIGRLWEEKPPRYSRALLETLALIAYRQPITRGDIEEIRGVSVATSTMNSLLEREWIRVVGHRDVPGRPSLYATTKGFLDYFNLKSLDELPPLAEIRDIDRINEELAFATTEPPGVGAVEEVSVPAAPEPMLLPQALLDAEPDEIPEEEDDLQAVGRRVDEIERNLREFMGHQPSAGEDEDTTE